MYARVVTKQSEQDKVRGQSGPGVKNPSFVYVNGKKTEPFRQGVLRPSGLQIAHLSSQLQADLRALAQKCGVCHHLVEASPPSLRSPMHLRSQAAKSSQLVGTRSKDVRLCSLFITLQSSKLTSQERPSNLSTNFMRTEESLHAGN